MVGPNAPDFNSFKNTVKDKAVPLESALEELITLLKRRQIRGSRLCAEATALLLRNVVESFKVGDASKLIENVQSAGRRLVSAQPREFAIGNIVRRVLGLIREELEEDREIENSGVSESGSESQAPGNFESGGRSLQRPLIESRRLTSSPLRNGMSEISAGSTKDGQNPGSVSSKSMFSLLSQPQPDLSPSIALSSHDSTGHQSPLSKQALANLDAAEELRAEVVEGILEIIQELKQADEQIASYALEHIHSNEIILTHSMSETIHKFLLKAATRRKFTVLCAESYPNESKATLTFISGEKRKLGDDTVSEKIHKSLTAAGLTVILIPDSAVFALMSRVNKIILDTHVVMSNGGLIAMAGAKQIAQAAKMHRTPVVVLSGVYKLSPVYPFDVSDFLEDADPSKVIPYEDRAFVRDIVVENPLFDYVPAELIDIYITNLGGHAPSYLYRIIADHYRTEDIDLK